MEHLKSHQNMLKTMLICHQKQLMRDMQRQHEKLQQIDIQFQLQHKKGKKERRPYRQVPFHQTVTIRKVNKWEKRRSLGNKIADFPSTRPNQKTLRNRRPKRQRLPQVGRNTETQRRTQVRRNAKIQLCTKFRQKRKQSRQRTYTYIERLWRQFTRHRFVRHPKPAVCHVTRYRCIVLIYFFNVRWRWNGFDQRCVAHRGTDTLQRWRKRKHLSGKIHLNFPFDAFRCVCFDDSGVCHFHDVFSKNIQRQRRSSSSKWVWHFESKFNTCIKIST